MPIQNLEIPMPDGRTLVWNPLNSRLNMIVGDNGSGKSLLLRRICAELGGKTDDPFFKRKLFQSDKKSNVNPSKLPCVFLDGEFMAMAEYAPYPKPCLLDILITDMLKQLAEYPLEQRKPFLDQADKFLDHSQKRIVFGGNAIAKAGGHFVFMKNWSSGERKIIYILVSAYLMHLANPHFVLLADCIEYSLSVHWQRMLLDALSEMCPDAQIIMSTHSVSLIGKYLDDSNSDSLIWDIESLMV